MTAEKICSVYYEGLKLIWQSEFYYYCYYYCYSGDTTLKVKARVGSPSDFDNNLLNTILQSSYQSTKGIAETLNITQSTVNSYLEEIRENQQVKNMSFSQSQRME